VFFVLTFGRFSGLVTRRSNFKKKTWNVLILNSYKSFKTEYIYTKINCGLYVHTYIGLWFEGKKRGHLRTIFSTSGYRYPEVRNIFANISAKTKYFSKIFWGIAQGPGYYRIMQKTRHQKSHASVPFSNLSFC